MKIVSNGEMREIESIAINTVGLPSVCLMENAGRSVAEHAAEYLFSCKRKNVVILCGKGNNGGDGFVAARYLLNKGFDVKVFVVSSIGLISGDAKKNLDIIINMGIYVAEILQKEQLKFFEKSIKESDLVIDALYGTGLDREVSGISKDAIDIVNGSGKYVISVDIPSGINGDNGKVEGCAVKANVTVTMQFMKKGIAVYPGVDYAGKVVVADIGIPHNLVDNIKCRYNMISQDDVALPKRARNTHKGDYGKLLIVAGSKNMTGAAALCAMSAIKTGCGIVKLAVPKAIQGIMQSSLREIITYGLDDKDGAFYLGSVDEVLKLANTVDAVAIGPGLTNSCDVREFVKEVISRLEKPLVLDADALNAISDSVDMIIGKDVILTPHIGEMSRLSGSSVDEINDNIYETVEKFISKYKATLVLKGSRTVIGNDTEGIYINCTGNPGMATAGSGDVLTGMISSFLVQGLKGVKAAIYGVYYHGKAGDMASERYGEYGLTATNILEYIPYAMKM